MKLKFGNFFLYFKGSCLKNGFYVTCLFVYISEYFYLHIFCITFITLVVYECIDSTHVVSVLASIEKFSNLSVVIFYYIQLKRKVKIALQFLNAASSQRCNPRVHKLGYAYPWGYTKPISGTQGGVRNLFQGLPSFIVKSSA